jgi:hypothetical protein
LQNGDEVGNESIQLGLVSEVAIEGEKDVESADDGRWANAVAYVGADEGEDDESWSICRVKGMRKEGSKRVERGNEPPAAPPDTGWPSKPGM